MEKILLTYVTQIKSFEKDLGQKFTGQDVFNYYKSQSQIDDMEAFTNLRFERQFKKYIENQEQYDYLTEKAKNITHIAQRLFEKRFPQYYTVNPEDKFKKSLDS